MSASIDQQMMSAALEIAWQGQGTVEPNPMVGCAIVANQEIIGIGYHEKFGGPHAEINALCSVPPQQRSMIPGATAYVTLEPCSHHGKTGPCCDALIDAGIGHVVVALTDPNPLVSGQGIAKLRDAGITVDVGVMQSAAQELLAPYLKKINTGLPWVVAKWAMTVDGRIATASGSSQWITNSSSRQRVHQLRRRCDAVMVGIGTAIADDPMLNPRPPGSRKVWRIVVDSQARLPIDSKIASTAQQHPTLIAVGPNANPASIDRLKKSGCRVWQGQQTEANRRLLELLAYLADQLNFTNIMIEGGSELLGSFHDLHQIDEVHAFVGAKLIGGAQAVAPLAGMGMQTMTEATQLALHSIEQLDSDIYAVYRRRANLST